MQYTLEMSPADILSEVKKLLLGSARIPARLPLVDVAVWERLVAPAIDSAETPAVVFSGSWVKAA